MITFKVNSVAFEAGIQRLRQGVKDGFIDPRYGTLAVQAELLSKRCQDFTPPRNLGQGNAAVARDLTVIFKPITQTTFDNKGLRKIIRTDNRPAWEQAAMKFDNSKGLQNTKAMSFSTAWHQKNRISRGRGRRGKNDNLGFVTLGPEAREARAYIKTVKKRVGWARAGWNMGIIAFGGTVSTSWVSRHGMIRGAVVDGRSNASPYIRVLNDTGWAKYNAGGEGQRILGNAVRSRAADMQTYFRRMMLLAKTKAEAAAKSATQLAA
jgi:hypothetical protein